MKNVAFMRVSGHVVNDASRQKTSLKTVKKPPFEVVFSCLCEQRCDGTISSVTSATSGFDLSGIRRPLIFRSDWNHTMNYSHV